MFEGAGKMGCVLHSDCQAVNELNLLASKQDPEDEGSGRFLSRLYNLFRLNPRQESGENPGACQQFDSEISLL
jgi:hypothetical protein